ncbi:hypothetical protein hmeg3_03915 [Herbaspirillum sp. meg3]|nr:hypothetical protein hmeg3_03915 [Herbaspirillum sp. meg3]
MAHHSFPTATSRSANKHLVWRRYLSAITLLLSASSMASAQDDPALHGCWQSQQIQVTLASQKVLNQNGDCTGEYDGSFTRAHCYNEAGNYEALSTYEVTDPGHMRATLIDPATQKPKAASYDVEYRVDGDWLIIKRQFPASLSAGNPDRPVSIQSLSVRVKPKDGVQPLCQPQGKSAIRIGRTSVSSLALSVPEGWQPFLVDPATDRKAALAVGAGFLVGAFVPLGASPTQLVFIVDDTRYGPTPLRQAEFVGVRKRFSDEVGNAVILCDQPDKICALLSRTNGPSVYTELVNVKGRVAIVTSSAEGKTKEVTLQLRKAVQKFTQRLIADNP